MKKKITSSFILLIFILTVAFSGIMTFSVTQMMTMQLKDRFVSEAKLTSQLFVETYTKYTADAYDYETFIQEIRKNTQSRVTVISEDGTVLADSSENPSKMDNHIKRPEVVEAIKTGDLGVSIRYSDTVKSDFIYVAIPVTIDSQSWYIRVSKRLVELEEMNARVLTISLILIGFSGVVAFFISLAVSKKITTPIDALTKAANEIAHGDIGKKIYIHSHDQIGNLADSFNLMSETLSETVGALRNRNFELETILNSMTNGVIAVDKMQKIILINQYCYKLLNIPESEDVKNSPSYIVIRNDEILRLIEKTLHFKIAHSAELVYTHNEKILSVTVNPIFERDSVINGAIIVIQDITQIRKLEKMRSDFVSNVSHELKTPLTSIKGFVDTLKNGAINDSATAMRFLDIIDIESDRLSRLINDILLLSEIESREVTPEQTMVDLRSVLNEVVDILKYNAQNKGLSLVFQYETENEVTIFANRDRIKQLFINLVDNAIKYTEKGSVTIWVSQRGSWVSIKVIDTGVGFDSSHKERLFERFYRVDKGRSRSQGGTGLGLSIVKHITMLYNGRITVESAVGQGSTFEVNLPLVQD